MTKKLIFMGTPAFAVPALRILHAAGHDIVAVYTQPPRPAGRGQKLRPSPVQQVAEELGLPVRHPEKLKGDALAAVLAEEVDLICVIAYGLLLPKALVENRLCLNVHPSALPRWRGAAPLQHTILAGDDTTDVCIMELDAGMDTGPVRLRHPVTVGANETVGELHDRLAQEGATLLNAVVTDLEAYPPVPQIEEGMTHAHKLTPDMRPIDWSQPACEVHNHIRGFAPAPGATCQHGEETLKILRSQVADMTGAIGEILAIAPDGVLVGCGAGSVRLLTLQRSGKKAQDVQTFLQGYPLRVGETLA